MAVGVYPSSGGAATWIGRVSADALGQLVLWLPFRSADPVTLGLPSVYPGPRWLRARLPFLALAVATIGAGLAVHYHGQALSVSARDVLGDALWAMMVAWWVGVAAPHAPLHGRSLVALGLCVAVEVSQLLHTPALDALRRTTVGHLTLGSDFDVRDLVAYAVGLSAAALLEVAWAGRRRSRNPGS